MLLAENVALVKTSTWTYIVFQTPTLIIVQELVGSYFTYIRGTHGLN